MPALVCAGYAGLRQGRQACKPAPSPSPRPSSLPCLHRSLCLLPPPRRSALPSLRHALPPQVAAQAAEPLPAEESGDLLLPEYSTDEFRMFSFKIDCCPRLAESHDWTLCPFQHPGGALSGGRTGVAGGQLGQACGAGSVHARAAARRQPACRLGCQHPACIHAVVLFTAGEKARRRDPRCFKYQGVPCPDFRKVGEGPAQAGRRGDASVVWRTWPGS